MSAIEPTGDPAVDAELVQDAMDALFLRLPPEAHSTIEMTQLLQAYPSPSGESNRARVPIEVMNQFVLIALARAELRIVQLEKALLKAGIDF